MKIKCPACSAVLNIPESAAGKVVKCPCGKQLRAPGGAAKPAVAARPSGAATPSRPAAARPAPQSAESSMGDLDPAMFDELTDDDLQQPVRAASRPGAATGGINPYAVGAAGSAHSRNSGNIASIGQRIAGAVIDGLFNMTGFVAGMLVVMLVAPAADGAGDEAAAGIGLVLMFALFFLGSIPFIINMVLISMSGQSLGKKIVKTRIVDKQTGVQVGFLHGVLIRNIGFGAITAIPVIGGFIAIADLVYLFTQGHETLHDKLAQTIVVEA
ncbi:RDD family protein [Novipirellula galeiformis]|uniref:RDD family protein n=1 Tax=Novipirellula galeiformis TaxID=2528004 RepID=A0A5C6CNK0_9BACT|nr:RDD family protein [Novipirellula galeiformis]TWU26543.1 RDD family protein [Novipirellula galeiformis]